MVRATIIPIGEISLRAWGLLTGLGTNRFCAGAGASSIRHPRHRESATPSEPTRSIRELRRDALWKDGQAPHKMASVPSLAELLKALAIQ